MQSLSLRGAFGLDGSGQKNMEEKGMIMANRIHWLRHDEITRRPTASTATPREARQQGSEKRGTVTDLVRSLEHEDARVRESAARLLGFMGAAARAAAPALMRALRDQSPVVRRCADRALGRMGLAADSEGPAVIGAF